MNFGKVTAWNGYFEIGSNEFGKSYCLEWIL